MTAVKDTVERKYWLFFGSSVGGALCTLLIHLNEVMPDGHRISFGLPMGLALSAALGMIAGLIGGAFGSFISGAIAGEDVFLNIGQSLGIGLINGFVIGTIIGIGLGLIHEWQPGLITPNVILYVTAAVIVVSIGGYMITKKRNPR